MIHIIDSCLNEMIIIVYIKCPFVIGTIVTHPTVVNLIFHRAKNV